MPDSRYADRFGTQKFVVSHLDPADFKRDGLRPYFEYRDLGIAAATNGLAQAHVNRAAAPCQEGGFPRHYHETEFQFVYLLSGTLTCDFEGQGVITMRAGSSWIQPPGVRHAVLHYSDDFQSLEIIIPANFGTVEEK